MAHCKYSQPTNDPKCRRCQLDGSLTYGPYNCYCINHELSWLGKTSEWIEDTVTKIREFLRQY